MFSKITWLRIPWVKLLLKLTCIVVPSNLRIQYFDCSIVVFLNNSFDNDKPNPQPRFFVVKPGSKILLNWFWIPLPVSETFILQMHLLARFSANFPFLSSHLWRFLPNFQWSNCVMLFKETQISLWRLERKFNLFWESRL
jgi:hypothetical protein